MTPLTYFLNGRHKAGNNCRAVSFKDTQLSVIMSTPAGLEPRHTGAHRKTRRDTALRC
jgi:hypothetical protein